MGSQAQNDIEDLKRRLNQLESNIVNIVDRVDTAEDNISNLQSNIGDGNSGGLGNWILKYEQDGIITDESVLDDAFEELPEDGILAVKENQE